MSHFAYIRPSGIWNGGIPVLHGELQQIDQQLFKALNADDGGNYAPSSIINIGGAGLTARFVGACSVDGASAQITFQNGASLYQNPGSVAYFSGNLNLQPSSLLTGLGSCSFLSGSATTFANGSNLNLSGRTDIYGPVFSHGAFLCTSEGALSVGCTTTLSGATTISGTGIGLVVSTTSNFTGTTLLSGLINVQQGGTLKGPLQTSQAGRVTKRVKFFSSTSSDGSFGPAQWDRVYVANLTANVNFTIDDTSAVDGDEMVFVNNTFGFHVTLLAPFGGTLATLILVKGQARAVTVTRSGGNWFVLLQEIFQG